MSGRPRIAGDISLAMKMQNVLQMVRGPTGTTSQPHEGPFA